MIKTETNISMALDAAGEGAEAQYDQNAKYLLADKQILARILKYTLREFADMEVNEICGCIGERVEVSDVPTDPGQMDFGRAILENSEDTSPGEGKIFYDIRFSAGRERRYCIFLDVEAQRTPDPVKLGYHIENRMGYYLARMVSAQKGSVFFHDDYDRIRKAVSIWICMNAGEEEESIVDYVFGGTTVYGETPPANLELMQGIIIRINGKTDGTMAEKAEEAAGKHKLISMLKTLFSEESVAEKKEKLAREHGIVMTVELEGRLERMCNLSQGILERGYQKGLETGKSLGIAQGELQHQLIVFQNCINRKMTREDAISISGITEEVLRENNL